MECKKRRITKNEKIGSSHYVLSYKTSLSEKDILPGQFVSIKVDNEKTILRRPFSIFDVRGNEISLFYRVVGMGTRLLSEKKSGEMLDVLEILGNGFDCKEKEEPVALVGGGMGIAPLFYLSKKLRAMKKEVTVYIGAQTANEIFFEKEFQNLGCRVCVTTDDGSKNICGTVCCGLETDCLKKHFRKIYACGPKAMLKSVAEIARKTEIPCEISLEEIMGCGFGICLGCAVKVRHSEKDYAYAMVCKDGPTFNVEEIEWD